MNKANSSLYIICRFPVFNPEKAPSFENFSAEDSVLLYSTLLLNNKEIAESSESFTNYYFCLDENDREFLPDELNNSGSIIWRSTDDLTEFIMKMSERIFSRFHNNIIITSDSIGTSSTDLKKIFNLLAIEDDALILAKTFNNKISSIGFNRIDQYFIEKVNWHKLDYDSTLNAACRQDANLTVVNYSAMIQDNTEFKKLYHDLSKKESLAYCSPKMHERFTHLFIEYKDLLK